MKILLFLVPLLAFYSIRSFALDDDKKDWTLDLKTSTLVPKFLGKVKIIRGKVMSGENELAKGDKVFPKNTIVTAEKSFVVVELVDETVLTLGPSSEFKMEDWAFRAKGDREGTLSLIKGKMRAEIKMKVKEDDQLKIKSPLVAMGIRGTEVLLNNSQVKGKWVTQVALMEGKVQLLNSTTKKETPLAKNDYVEVTEGSDATDVANKLSEADIKKYNTIVAPSEKLLMDYPVVAMNEAANDPKEEGTDGGALVKTPNSSSPIFNNLHEASSWKDNLDKLNELRKKPD